MAESLPKRCGAPCGGDSRVHVWPLNASSPQPGPAGPCPRATHPGRPTAASGRPAEGGPPEAEGPAAASPCPEPREASATDPRPPQKPGSSQNPNREPRCLDAAILASERREL